MVETTEREKVLLGYIENLIQALALHEYFAKHIIQSNSGVFKWFTDSLEQNRASFDSYKMVQVLNENFGTQYKVTTGKEVESV